MNSRILSQWNDAEFDFIPYLPLELVLKNFKRAASADIGLDVFFEQYWTKEMQSSSKPTYVLVYTYYRPSAAPLHLRYFLGTLTADDAEDFAERMLDAGHNIYYRFVK